MYSSISFPRTKSKCLVGAIRNRNDCCCFWVYSVGIRISILTWCLEKKGPVYVAMFSPLSIVIAVIMGVAFLGDSLHIGSAIGAVIIIAGFYVVMWGQAQEKNKLEDNKHLDVANESGLSDQTAPLLFSLNESTC
ncbi:putative EamA domain-containing protein [Helianthus debilis subsp. tardiflorus]